MKNSFLSEFKEREYFNQCTNSEELDNLMHSKKINAYIGCLLYTSDAADDLL